MGQDQVSRGVNVLCWLAAPFSMFYENFPKFGNNVKIDNKVQFGYRSQIGEISDQWRVSLYMVMSQNVM